MLRSTIHPPPIEEGEFLLYFVKIVSSLILPRVLLLQTGQRIHCVDILSSFLI